MRITPPTSLEILDEKYVLFFDDFFFYFSFLRILLLAHK